MRLIINEEQCKMLMKEMREELISEMAYPTSFDFEEFRQCRSFAERVRYCEARLQRISSGSSRIVYRVDDDKVLKLAKNQKGIAQNKVEQRLGTEPYYTCFADVYEYDEDGLWVEMEICQKAKKSDFKKIYGVPFEVLCCMMTDFANSQSRSSVNFYSDYRNAVQEIWDGEDSPIQDLFMSLQEYIGGEMLTGVGDLCRISSWGINSDGYFILIDYGLDDDVWEQYYKKGFKFRY